MHQFIFAHEFAHVAYGQDCDSHSTDPLVIEQRCDELAYKQLRKAGESPVAVILWLVSMHHYEQLFAPVFQRASEHGHRSYEEVYPARNWTARARKLYEAWKAECGGDLAQPSCGSPWQGAARTAEMVLDIPRPRTCVLDARSSAPSPPIKDDPAARACLELGDTDKANYNENGLPNLVSVELPYRDACARPIRCAITIACGTVARHGPKQGSWQPYTSVTREISLTPGGTASVPALLRWYASAERMPSMRYPDEDEAADFARCEFSGPAQDLVSPASECSDVRAYVAAADDGFTTLPRDQPSNDPGYVHVTGGAGVSDCFYTPADQSPAVLQCGILSTRDLSALSSAYDTWVKRLRRCLPQPLWNASSDTLSSWQSIYQSTEFARSEHSTKVETTMTTSIRGDKHRLHLSVTAPEPPLSQRHAAPASNRLPSKQVPDLSAAVDAILDLVAKPAELAKVGGIEIAHSEHAGFDEVDRCFPPKYSVDGDCYLNWTCSTRVFFTQSERMERFDQLVHRYVSRFKPDPGWIARTTDDPSNWVPVRADHGAYWSARQKTGNMSIHITANNSSYSDPNIEVVISATLPTSVAGCTVRAKP